MKNLSFKWICLFMFLFVSTALYAQDDASYLVYKQDLMKSNGMQMGMIGQILQKDLPFKNHAKLHAQTVQSNMQMFLEASMKKIVEGKTDSKADVWSNWNQFKANAEASIAAAADLAQAGDNEIMGKVRELGGTCGACHQNFRKPKNERFPR